MGVNRGVQSIRRFRFYCNLPTKVIGICGEIALGVVIHYAYSLSDVNSDPTSLHSSSLSQNLSWELAQLSSVCHILAVRATFLFTSCCSGLENMKGRVLSMLHCSPSNLRPRQLMSLPNPSHGTMFRFLIASSTPCRSCNDSPVNPLLLGSAPSRLPPSRVAPLPRVLLLGSSVRDLADQAAYLIPPEASSPPDPLV